MTTYSITVSDLLSKCPLINLDAITDVRRCRYLNKTATDIVFNHRQYISVHLLEAFLEISGHILDAALDRDVVTFTVGTDERRVAAQEWVERQCAPVEPGPTGDRPNLYDLARRTIEARQCWTAGETVTIWAGNGYTAYVRHTSQDLFLGLCNGKPEQAAEVRASHLDLASGPFWPFTLTRDEYTAWVQEARRL